MYARKAHALGTSYPPTARSRRSCAGMIPTWQNERNRKTGKLWWGKLAARTVIAAFVGLCFGWGLVSLLFKLIG